MYNASYVSSISLYMVRLTVNNDFEMNARPRFTV